MSFTKRLTGGLLAATFALLALACASQQPAAPYSPPDPTAAPDIAATVTARDMALSQREVAAPVISEGERQAYREFASAHARLLTSWERVDRDIERWRQGLTSCDASAARVALRGFAGDFGAVSQAAQRLPRFPLVRPLSDQLIDAAQDEEAALRRLRDNWQPGQQVSSPASDGGPAGSGGNGNGEKNGDESNGTVASPPAPGFEGAVQARANALSMRNEVADRLSDLQESTSQEAEAGVLAFADGFDVLSGQWDQFHQDYDSFRAAQPGLSPEAALGRLNELVDQHRELASAHRSLPSNNNTRYVSDLLAGALEAEELDLRRLRGSFQAGDGEDGADDSGPAAPSGRGLFGGIFGPPPSGGNGEQSGGEGSGGGDGGSGANGNGEPEPTPTPEPVEEPAKGVSIQAGDQDLFDAMDERIVLTNQTRREAGLALERAMADASSGSRAAVAAFAVGYDGLVRRWDAFHRDYDAWLAGEGGCDRSAAAGAIGGFALSVGEIAAEARRLPTQAAWKSLVELTVEAAQRQEDALRELRGSWTPFDASVYRDLDGELAASGKLRRQAALGVRELADRYAE